MKPQPNEVWLAVGLFPDEPLERVRVEELRGAHDEMVDVEYLDGSGYRILPVGCLVRRVESPTEEDV